jgi:hypothetical protein
MIIGQLVFSPISHSGCGDKDIKSRRLYSTFQTGDIKKMHFALGDDVVAEDRKITLATKSSDDRKICQLGN